MDIGAKWTCRSSGRAALARAVGTDRGQMCWGAIREGLAHVAEAVREGTECSRGGRDTSRDWRGGGEQQPYLYPLLLLWLLGWGGGLPFRGDAHL